jgi:hypothetical protein
MLTVESILTADEAWVALASLHRRYTERESFSAKEVMESAKREKAHPELRAGLQAHIYLHNVANVAPNSARYRMFLKVAEGTYRLYRPGDDCHPDRKGKMAPRREELPVQYHPLLDWYEKDYAHLHPPLSEEDDPVLGMWGVGKEIWKEGGDVFVARERARWEDAKEETLASRTWKRITEHQGLEFRTKTGLKFTYSVEDENGIWFKRNGKRINQRLWRGEVEKAVMISPADRPSEFSKFRDSSYLFGLLMDSRIRGADW